MCLEAAVWSFDKYIIPIALEVPNISLTLSELVKNDLSFRVKIASEGLLAHGRPSKAKLTWSCSNLYEKIKRFPSWPLTHALLAPISTVHVHFSIVYFQ